MSARTSTQLGRLAAAGVTALVLAGCGSDEDPTLSAPSASGSVAASPTSSPTGPPGEPSVGVPSSSDPVRLEGTRVTVTAVSGPDAEPQTWALVCDPPGGDHPDPAAACRALVDAGPAALPPVPGDVVCAQVFGGPETARVEGVVAGEVVDATFSRTDGCEISRWDALAPLFPIPVTESGAAVS